MEKVKRYTPLLILFELYKLIKKSIFFVILLFVIKSDSQSNFVIYGRYIFCLVFGITLIVIMLKWFTHKYKLDDTSFHLYEGTFSKSERTIPFSKIQNVNRHTSLFHRIFKVTSISFETGMNGEDATVKFEVISQNEADQIEAHMTNAVRNEWTSTILLSKVDMENVNPKRTTHFKPTRKDILKASFTSQSFLVLIPLIVSFYFKIKDFFHVKEVAEGIFEELTRSWWLITIIIIVLGIASAVFGIVRTFFKYGKYEISSDQERIYITKGLIDEMAFSIAKEKVQAIEIKQSIMKRFLGLAEVKLTSAGNHNLEEGKLEINSLYPFLPIKRAYELISEILPSYEVTSKMTRLPQKIFMGASVVAKLVLDYCNSCSILFQTGCSKSGTSLVDSICYPVSIYLCIKIVRFLQYPIHIK